MAERTSTSTFVSSTSSATPASAHPLQDALPPLSEPALDDAAQPLEDLEEHRRNVENLTDTSRALSALGGVYRDYARTELHARTAEFLALRAVTDADRLRRCLPRTDVELLGRYLASLEAVAAG